LVFSIFLIIITVERKKLINFLVSIVIPNYNFFLLEKEKIYWRLHWSLLENYNR